MMTLNMGEVIRLVALRPAGIPRAISLRRMIAREAETLAFVSELAADCSIESGGDRHVLARNWGCFFARDASRAATRDRTASGNPAWLDRSQEKVVVPFACSVSFA